DCGRLGRRGAPLRGRVVARHAHGPRIAGLRRTGARGILATVRRPRGTIALLATLALLLVETSIARASGPQPVLTSRRDEKQPASNGTYLAWAQNSVGAPGHFDVFIRRGTGARHRVNPVGTA